MTAIMTIRFLFGALGPPGTEARSMIRESAVCSVSCCEVSLKRSEEGFIERPVGSGIALKFAKLDLRLAELRRRPLHLLEALADRLLAAHRHPIFILGRSDDPIGFGGDLAGDIGKLRPRTHHRRMT